MQTFLIVLIQDKNVVTQILGLEEMCELFVSASWYQNLALKNLT